MAKTKILSFLKENILGGIIGFSYPFIYNFIFPHCAWFIKTSSEVTGGCSTLALVLSFPLKILDKIPFLGVAENFIWTFEYAIIFMIIGMFIQSKFNKRRNN